MGAMQPFVTAYSTVSGLGHDVAESTGALKDGQRGLTPCPLDLNFDTVCGAVLGPLPEPPTALAAYDSRTLRLALMALSQIQDAVTGAAARYGPHRVALVLATSTGGIASTEQSFFQFAETGTFEFPDFEKQHPFFAIAGPLKTAAGVLGPATVISTACSSSTKAFGSAQRLLQSGVADAVIVAGADSLAYTTVRGFHSLGVLSPGPCRPFGENRPGMNVGEGASMVLLERDGTTQVRLLGVGESSDAYHMSSPDPEGRGAIASMSMAIERAGINAADVDYINAHGTGTKHNDIAESRAIASMFGDRVPVASTKGYTGHLLGAAGATEAVFSIAAIERGWLPKSAGAEPLDPEVQISILRQTTECPVRYALTNNFAFGGSNASLLFGSVE